MAMNKILYVVPALALLGLIPAADADTIQERIERLQERIAELQERIDQSPDSEKVAKWEAKVDRLQERVAELEARQAKAAQTITPPREPASARHVDTKETDITLESAVYDPFEGTLTLTFSDEVTTGILTSLTIRGSGLVTGLHIGDQGTGDTFTINVGQNEQNIIGRMHNPEVTVIARHIDGIDEDQRIPLTVVEDTTPPSFVSAELDLNTEKLKIVFSEPVDVSEIDLSGIHLGIALTDGSRTSAVDTASDSDTVIITVHQAVLDWVAENDVQTVDVTKFSSVKDPAGNKIGRVNDFPLTVIPADTTPPAITLRGDDPLAHELGEPYADPGADADDASAVTTDASAVNVDRRGDYVVTYTATDGNGNEGTASRTVQVRDTTPPTVQSATLDASAGTLTIAFDEAIDVSEVATEEIGLGGYVLAYSSFDGTAPDSDTLVLAVSQAILDTIGGLESPELDFATGSVRDVAGNLLQAVTVPMTVTNAPEETPTDETPTEVPAPDATVTITADGRFTEDAGTIEVQLGGDMTLDVRFVNEHASDHTVLADLISWHFGHQSDDIALPSGQSATRTFTVQEDAPRIGTDSERANVYLVFGVANIESTPEHEPDTIRGDHAIKVRITEPPA